MAGETIYDMRWQKMKPLRWLYLAPILAAIFPHYALTQSDTTKPTLAGITFSPTAVNVTNASAPVVATFTVGDDLSGVAWAAVELASPSHNQFASCGSSTTPSSGTPTNGVFTCTLTIKKSAEPGLWKPTTIRVEDKAGNVLLADTASVSAGVTVTSATPDTTKPTLDSVTFSPTTVDVTSAPATVLASFTVRDDLSGVAWAAVDVSSPSGTQFAGCGSSTAPVTGTPNDGVFTCTLTIKKYAEPGLWKPSTIRVEDRTGNILFAPTEGISAGVTVTSATPDTTKPTLDGVTFSPITVDVSNAPATVLASFAVRDELSGVAWASMDFSSPSGTQSVSCGSSTAPVTGTPNNGVFTCSLTIKKSAESGFWKPSAIRLDDKAGNILFANTGSLSAGVNVTTTPAPPQALRFVPVAPCRVVDTRKATGLFGGPPMAASVIRDFAIPASACNIPATALAYSLNVTVVPLGSLGYLSLWPAGQAPPVVSTLNSLDGRIKANAAIVPAGANGAISILVTDASHVILDINGYFVPATAAQSLAFYAVPPCRISDTRNAVGTFGGPALFAGVERIYPVISGPCGIPPTAQAYALNLTVVPNASLGYLTTWPTGQNMPLVSTLNALTGAITANMAIVPAGASGAISMYATEGTELVIDIMGYFAPPGGTGSMDFFSTTPCRISDTRDPVGAFGGPGMAPGETRSFLVPVSSCGIPGSARAYSVNATVVPQPTLGYLTLWGSGPWPLFSTLNALDGTIVANAALVPAGISGELTAYTSSASHLILDINGYFQ